jgi:hypothetical protein
MIHTKIWVVLFSFYFFFIQEILVQHIIQLNNATNFKPGNTETSGSTVIAIHLQVALRPATKIKHSGTKITSSGQVPSDFGTILYM